MADSKQTELTGKLRSSSRTLSLRVVRPGVPSIRDKRRGRAIVAAMLVFLPVLVLLGCGRSGGGIVSSQDVKKWERPKGGMKEAPAEDGRDR